jgi:hypothetical protein
MRYILITMALFVLGAGSVALYSATREQPKPRITGDYTAAAQSAQASGARLLLVVDQAPAFL